MPIMVQRNKWILYKHTSNYEMIKAVALDVKNSCKTEISDTEKHRMQERLAALNLYKTRNPKNKPLDSINHRINTLEYWMFGYENKINREKKFIFSPLGNLFLKYINDVEKTRKIFITMLFAMQFQHPASGTDKEFQLFPFRLIFKLLLDERLECKLYNFEVEYLVVFQNKMDEAKYETLVGDILKFRELPNEEIAKKFQADQHTFVNTVYEWEYYTQTLLETIGILEKCQGEFICKLYHPTKTNSKSAPTGRNATAGYVSVNEACKDFILKLLDEYSCFDIPIRLDDPERLQIDAVKEIYSFYPQVLLDEINESDKLTALLELPKLIEEYSKNSENKTSYLFEDVLTEGFNMFYNVDAVKKGGASNTDIECLYTTKNKKFAVESKSTANKLTGINAGRLTAHRKAIGGEYTIVITPKYMPATRGDILDTSIVIILASTFSEYLYNHIFHDVRDIDFADFDNIIIDNLGTDVSQLISNMTLEKFATS